jgi:outer membrane protein insertion porin family
MVRTSVMGVNSVPFCHQKEKSAPRFSVGISNMSLTIAASREVFLNFFKPVATVCLFLFTAQTLAAQQPRENSQTKYIIERIELIGNRRIESDTLRARISTRSGDPYNVEAVRRDVQALWNTQFFDDVRSEVEDSPHLPNGKIVVFIVVERPIIGRIEYKGIKSITESDILNAFKDEGVGLTVGSLFDRAKLKRGVVVISELLAAHGHQFATVKPTYEQNPSTNTVTLVFNIDEGPKTQKSRNRS